MFGYMERAECTIFKDCSNPILMCYVEILDGFLWMGRVCHPNLLQLIEGFFGKDFFL